jgi:hypothetical protein
MAKKSLGGRFIELMFGPPVKYPSKPEVVNKNLVPVPGKPDPVNLPTTRRSSPNLPIDTVNFQSPEYRIVNRDYLREAVQIIRTLSKINPDLGQAIHNIVTLGNTGHKVIFDRSVDPELADKMRRYLEFQKIDWAYGCAGVDGLVNKMFAQILIGGALSCEWVPTKKLDGIETVLLVNPDDIDFVLEPGNMKYTPYQRIRWGFLTEGLLQQFNLLKLNTNTYRYYALNGDTEIPYGFPPYLAALENIGVQKLMNKNITHVTKQLGLLGFLAASVQLPDQLDGESDADYEGRLTQILVKTKNQLLSGMEDGVVVGYKDQHEFDFYSLGKAVDQGIKLYENNELQIASGLKTDAALWGRAYATSETQISIVFMKMLSELRNIQNIVATNLQYGYMLALTLAGFKIDYLKVQFNRSTLQDDLKYQQAEEIKVRNVMQKGIMGVINQEQIADELGYAAPAYDEPMVPWEILAGGSTPTDNAEADQNRGKQKKASDKKTRQKNKPMPTK